MLQSINPATGELYRSHEEHTDTETGRLLDRAVTAQSAWCALPVGERAALLRNAAAVLRSEAPELAREMALEMGKPVTAGIAEAEKCAWVCDYYADYGEAFLKDEHIATDASRSYAASMPLGVVLAIMPWNFPLWQVFRFAAPTLLAGNAAVLKHASNVTGCALAIAGVLERAGFPSGLFPVVRMPGSRAEALIADPRIAAVTLTGSTEAGRRVAAMAGQHLKKSVLELGGSDPYLVLADADLDLAARACVTGRMINGGQSCIAAKRLIVVESVRPAFEEKVLVLMAGFRMADPLNETANLGPLARQDLRAELHDQVVRSASQGAALLMGGEIPNRPGWYYPPTVLSEVRPGMPAFDEELFGPVAAIVSARDEEDAIRLANRSRFGLGSAVFTTDLERGEQIARERIQAGSCFVNGFVKSDPRLPFGGTGDSGWGRELSAAGIREFLNLKTVWVK